jgi:hypothetical protein
MSYNPHAAPAAAVGSGSAASLSPGSLHPVGMLYTILRHGRGLSHEEANRISFESICDLSSSCRPSKAA